MYALNGYGLGKAKAKAAPSAPAVDDAMLSAAVQSALGGKSGAAGQSFLSKYKLPLIIGGTVLAGGVAFLLWRRLRKKR